MGGVDSKEASLEIDADLFPHEANATTTLTSAHLKVRILCLSDFKKNITPIPNKAI
jgi:hypothetical protein